MTSSTIVSRVAWKEYRTQRSLWLSVLVLTLLIQASVSLIAALTSDTGPVSGASFLVMALVGVGVYLLGCGATLFALEHEHGTFDFQRSLPLRVDQLYLAKIGTGVVGGLSLLAILLFLTHAFFVGWNQYFSDREWLAAAVSLAEVFAWSVFFSLVIRHPLGSAVCGIGAFAIVQTIFLSMLSVSAADQTAADQTEFFFRSHLAARLGILGLLWACDTWLAWRWFDGRIGLPNGLRPRASGADLGWWIPAHLPAAPPGARQLGWWRLIWISWRQGRWTLPLGIGLFALVFRTMLQIAGTGNTQTVTLLSGVVMLVIPAVFGLSSFTLDQWSNQFRFFAERGVHPAWLWLSRHVVWFPPVLIMAILVDHYFPSQVQSVRWPAAPSYVCLLMATLSYAVSQFCAMNIRNMLVATVVSLFAASAGQLWYYLSCQALGIPAWWSILPIPVVAMGITWSCCRDWIEERMTWRYWIRLSLAVGISAGLVLVGCTWFRVHEFPLVEPPFSMAEFTRPLSSDERATLAMYEQAERLLNENPLGLLIPAELANGERPTDDGLRAWLAASAPALALLERAHERPPAPIARMRQEADQDASPGPLGNAFPQGSALLLRRQADALTRSGELKSAWRYYAIALELIDRMRLRAGDRALHQAAVEEERVLVRIAQWSGHPMQSTERIATALDRLAELENLSEERDRIIRNTYVLWSQFLDGQLVAVEQLGMSPGDASNLQWLARLMPWEAARCRRALNLHTAMLRGQLGQPVKWVGRQPTLSNGSYPLLLLPVDQLPLINHSELVTSRQATRLQVALADWRRLHGELPRSLNQLVGPYFRELPIDPSTGESFAYFPVGISEDLPSGLSRGTPFISVRVWNCPRDLDLREKLRQSRIWSVPGP